MNDQIENTKQYRELFTEIIQKIRHSQYAALKAVNKELILLYWEIGKLIVTKQEEQDWGKSIVEILATELQVEFPGVKGFSARNLWNMRNFYTTYKNNIKLQLLAAEISWTHNVMIITRCKDEQEREFYIQMAKKFCWSKVVLDHQIDGKSYEKFLINQTSFDKTISKEYQDQAKLAVKDEYLFNFLELGNEHSEYELEKGLMNNIRKFLTEMGGYFTFVGSQYRMQVGEEEFFIDLLLYHRKLRCLVAVELKNDKFKPSHVGQLNFYLSALDDLVRIEGENPSIGILICRTKDRTVVEYALRDVNKPMGVSTYNISNSLPQEMKSLLPTPEEIAHHLRVFDQDTNE